VPFIFYCAAADEALRDAIYMKSPRRLSQRQLSPLEVADDVLAVTDPSYCASIPPIFCRAFFCCPPQASAFHNQYRTFGYRSSPMSITALRDFIVCFKVSCSGSVLPYLLRQSVLTTLLPPSLPRLIKSACSPFFAALVTPSHQFTVTARGLYR